MQPVLGAPESRVRVGLPAERFTLTWISEPYHLSPRVEPGLIVRSRVGKRVPRDPAPPAGQGAAQHQNACGQHSPQYRVFRTLAETQRTPLPVTSAKGGCEEEIWQVLA